MTAYQSGRELGRVVRDHRDPPAIASRSARRSKLVESELAAIATAGVTDDELRRVQNARIASFYFALEHIGGFGGVADRLNAYNVFRGDPSLITADVRRFQSVTAQDLNVVGVALFRRTGRT